eukprot:871687-Pleurochrysis_carterae.AAC.1
MTWRRRYHRLPPATYASLSTRPLHAQPGPRRASNQERLKYSAPTSTRWASLRAMEDCQQPSHERMRS